MSTNHLRAVSHITLAVTSSSLAETDVALWFASSKILATPSLSSKSGLMNGREGREPSVAPEVRWASEEEEGGGCSAQGSSGNHGVSERGSAFTELPQMHGFNQVRLPNFSNTIKAMSQGSPRFSSSSAVHHQHDPARASATLSCSDVEAVRLE